MYIKILLRVAPAWGEWRRWFLQFLFIFTRKQILEFLSNSSSHFFQEGGGLGSCLRVVPFYRISFCCILSLTHTLLFCSSTHSFLTHTLEFRDICLFLITFYTYSLHSYEIRIQIRYISWKYINRVVIVHTPVYNIFQSLRRENFVMFSVKEIMMFKVMDMSITRTLSLYNVHTYLMCIKSHSIHKYIQIILGRSKIKQNLKKTKLVRSREFDYFSLIWFSLRQVF